VAIRWVYRKPQWGEQVEWHALNMPRPVGEWWLNDNAGPLVTDASGGLNHGGFVGSPVWSTNRDGSAISCATNSDYVLTPGTLTTYSPYFTVVFCGSWNGIRPGGDDWTMPFRRGSDWSTGFAMLLNRGTSTTTCETRLYINGNQTATYVPNGSEIGTDTHTWVALSNGQQAEVWVDGMLKASANWSNPVSSSSAAFGILQPNASATWGYFGSCNYCLLFPEGMRRAQVEALQGPWPIWQPTYYSFASAATSALPAIMAHYRRLRSA